MSPALVAGLIGCDGVAGPIPVAEVQVTPTEATLELGGNLDVSATILDASGSPIDARRVTWSSNNPRVVTVTADGFLQAVGSGATTVSAESGGESAAIDVNVTVHFAKITAGYQHTCGMTQSGWVTCWGANGYGQLGDNTIFTSPAPVLVAADSTLLAVAAGGTQTCAISGQGTATCWGANWSAQLGVGTVDFTPHPVPASVLGGIIFGTVVTGDRHACGLTEAGVAYCWGGGLSGQLGNGVRTFTCPAIDEPCNTHPDSVSSAVSFRALEAGGEHTCALDENGSAYCWGKNRYGQLGDSTKTWSTVPVSVSGDLTFATIYAGGDHTCALSATGDAYCWGDNSFGQIGAGPGQTFDAPVPVEGGIVFQTLDVGGLHSCGIDMEGAAYCWGYNGWGQIGIGSTDDVSQPTPVATEVRFASISTGWAHTCAIATDGAAYCWGRNSNGQLGIGIGFGYSTKPLRLLGQE
jgi:alpha-tubulin suppressor-like RCC1 family protein